jgi:hypothetical protein
MGLAAARMVCTTPFRFTSSTCCHCARSNVSSRPVASPGPRPAAIPALANATSSRLCRSTTLSTSASTATLSATSRTAGSTAGRSLAAAASLASSRSAMITRATQLARTVAMARPSPDAPPVTRTTRPRTSKIRASTWPGSPAGPAGSAGAVAFGSAAGVVRPALAATGAIVNILLPPAGSEDALSPCLAANCQQRCPGSGRRA